MSKPKIPGIAFDFGGVTLIIPPLSLGHLEVMHDQLLSLDLSKIGASSISTILDAAHAALQRNYPEMTRAEVASVIDLGNMVEVTQCVMDIAGLRRKEIEQGKSDGATGDKLSWPQLYAQICANTGWTWDHVREHVDIPTLEALQAEWRTNPPVHHLVAAYLGYKAPATQAGNVEDPGELAQFMSVRAAPKVSESAWENRARKLRALMGDGSKEVKYEITADATGFTRAVEGVASVLSTASKQIDGQFKSIGHVFEGVQKQLLALTAVIAGAGAFKEAVSKTVELTGEAMHLSKALGISATEAGVLNTALGDIYTDSDTYITAFQKFAGQIKKNEAGLQSMGLETRNANGTLKDSNTLFMDALEQVKQYKPGLDQTTAAMVFFGKSVDDVMKLQKLDNEVLADARKKNEDLGLTITSQNVEANKKYKAAMNDVGDVMTAIQKVIGDALLPILTRLGEWFAETGPGLVAIFGDAIKVVGTVIQALVTTVRVAWDVLRGLANPIFEVASAIQKLLEGDMSGATKQMQNAFSGWGDAIAGGFGKAKDDIARTANEVVNLWSKGTAAAVPKKGTKTVGDLSGGKGSAGDKSQTGLWEAELAEAKLAYQEQENAQETFHQFSKQDELQFWRDKLALTERGTKDETTVRLKVADLQLAIGKDRFDGQIEDLKTEAEAWRNNSAEKIEVLNREAALLGTAYGVESKQYQAVQREIVAARRQAADQLHQIDLIGTEQVRQTQLANLTLEQQQAQLQLDLGVITQADMLAKEREFENSRNAIQQAALAERLALALQDPDRNPVEVARINAEMEALEREHQLRLSDLRKQSAVETSRDITSTLGSIQQSWAGLIQQLAQGTLTIGGFIRGMFQAVASAMINTIANLAAKWAVQQLQMLIFGKTTGASEVMANAAVAGSAAVASTAAIPIVGPELAPAAGVAAFAEASSYLPAVLASARGGYDIPANINPMTQLHAREMVLPAAQADVIRGLAGAQRSGPVEVILQAHPMPGNYFMVHRDLLMKAIKSAHRDFAA